MTVPFVASSTNTSPDCRLTASHGLVVARVAAWAKAVPLASMLDSHFFVPSPAKAATFSVVLRASRPAAKMDAALSLAEILPTLTMPA